VGLDADKILRAARMLSEKDVRMLAGMVSYIGVEPGVRGRLLSALNAAQDRRRADRLEPVLKRLSDAEILWLSENPEKLRRDARGRKRARPNRVAFR
jgi:hypothetical protein